MLGIGSILLAILQGHATMKEGDEGYSTTRGTTAIILNESKYYVRPYDSKKDQVALEQICKDVWKGTDYLPAMAEKFELDECCDFVVMQNEQEDVIALGNRKIFDMSTRGTMDHYHALTKQNEQQQKEQQKISWLEAIRISNDHMGKGLATGLIQALMTRSYNDGITNILSCTIESNGAMKKVFDRNGMKVMNKMCFLDFGKLKALPGWGKTSDENENNNHNAETLIKALNIEHTIQEDARTMKWTPLDNEMELNEILSQIKKSGGLGLFPGLGKPYYVDQQIRENLQKGLIRKLEDGDRNIVGLYALVKDVAIQSLKSNWVCSIIAFDSVTFESALWDSCSDNMVLKREGDAAFVVVYDNCLSKNLSSSSSSILSALPIKKDDAFILFSNS
jgi:hypothetical protein